MDRPHKEQWYQSHIWSMIESCLDKLGKIEAVCGETACLGSKKRQNINRAIDSFENNIPLEFGACEAKPKIENETGSNFMEEGFYKLPRTLKDIFDNLLEEINFGDRSSKIRTVGFLHSGLSSTFIQFDTPTRHISRISFIHLDMLRNCQVTVDDISWFIKKSSLKYAEGRNI